MLYPNLFKNYPGRQGKDWIKNLPKEDLRVFVEIGLEAGDHGRLGGIARATKAERDQRGRFAKGRSK